MDEPATGGMAPRLRYGVGGEASPTLAPEGILAVGIWNGFHHAPNAELC